MVENAQRSQVGDEPRAGDSREWEVFVRENRTDPLRHVGSVTAPSADVAHEQAGRLFARYADDLWLCPTDEVRRYSTHSLSTDDEPAAPEGGDEPRAGEP